MIDSVTGRVKLQQEIRVFSMGFDDSNEREKDENKEVIRYKTKYFPPKEDIAEKLPDHFNDFMKNIPFIFYSTRDEIFNLISYLLINFLGPELGPWLYMGYVLLYHPKTATTPF